MSIVVEVRAKESAAPGGRSGSYIRGGRVWMPGWQDALVDEKLLAEISNDPWLEVRHLDPRSQARKKLALAAQAEAAAVKAEEIAKELRANADKIAAEASEAVEAAKLEPEPPPPTPATPFKDAMVAAMPDEVRVQIELDRNAPFGRTAAQVASQLVGRELVEPAPASPATDAKPPKKK